MLVIEVRANTWFIPLIAISFLSFGKVSINIYCKNVCWVVIQSALIGILYLTHCVTL